MLHIDVQGRGPALILLHGWGLHGGVFAPLCRQLGAHFTLYNVDLPGHGRSSHLPVPASLDAWATAVLDEVPAGLWLGWSLGGLVAQRAAQLAPAQVRGLVSIASSPCFVRHAGWPHGIEPTVLVGFTGHLQQHYAQTVDRFLALDLMTLPGGQQAATDLRDALLAVGRPSDAALATGGQLLLDSDLRQQLPDLRMPSLWLAGQRDRLVTPAAMAAAASLAPQARQLTVPGTGHAPFLGDTAAIARAVLDFQRQCTG